MCEQTFTKHLTKRKIKLPTLSNHFVRLLIDYNNYYYWP